MHVKSFYISYILKEAKLKFVITNLELNLSVHFMLLKFDIIPPSDVETGSVVGLSNIIKNYVRLYRY